MSEKYTVKQAIDELQEYRNLLMEDPSDSGIDTGCVMAKAMELFLKIEQANGVNSKPANFAIFDVSQQRELFYNFITWYNAKPFMEKPKDGLITTTIIEDYLKL